MSLLDPIRDQLTELLANNPRAVAGFDQVAASIESLLTSEGIPATRATAEAIALGIAFGRQVTAQGVGDTLICGALTLARQRS